MIDILGMAFSGGLTGLVGSVFKGIAQANERKRLYKLELEFTRRMEIENTHELAVLELKHDQAKDAAALENLTTLIDADAKNYLASLRQDKATYGITWIDSIRGIIRPLITLSTLGMLVWIGVMLWRLTGGLGALPQTEILTMFKDLIDAVIYIASATTLWWFGDRSFNKIK